MTISSTESSLHYQSAVEAFEAVGIPPQTDRDAYPRIAGTKITNRTPFLPKELFKPVGYDLDEEAYWADVVDPWSTNAAKALLKRALGEDGYFAPKDIIGEYSIVAKDFHGAAKSYVTAHMDLSGLETDHVAFAAWDNGQAHRPQDMEANFSKDSAWDLTQGIGVRSRGPRESTVPTVIVSTAIVGHGGTVAVVSGGNRMDITTDGDQYTFSHSTVPTIVGNLVLAWMPAITRPQIG